MIPHKWVPHPVRAPGEWPAGVEAMTDSMPTGDDFIDAYYIPELVSTEPGIVRGLLLRWYGWCARRVERRLARKVRHWFGPERKL